MNWSSLFISVYMIISNSFKKLLYYQDGLCQLSWAISALIPASIFSLWIMLILFSEHTSRFFYKKLSDFDLVPPSTKSGV